MVELMTPFNTRDGWVNVKRAVRFQNVNPARSQEPGSFKSNDFPGSGLLWNRVTAVLPQIQDDHRFLPERICGRPESVGKCAGYDSK
jgi:hypothetical protein